MKIHAVLITALLSASIAAGQTNLRSPAVFQKAREQFQAATALEMTLDEKAPAERTRAEYLKVINAYQRVYLITPHTGYADNALITMARLYEEINDSKAAIKTLDFLIHEYPSSPFIDAAQKDIARLSGAPEPKSDTASVENVRFWEMPDSVRVAVDVTGQVMFKQGEAKSPDRVFLDLSPARLNSLLLGKQWSVNSASLGQIRVGQYEGTTVRVVLDVKAGAKVTTSLLHDPERLIIDVAGTTNPVVPAPAPVTEAAPPASRQTAAAAAPPSAKTSKADEAPKPVSADATAPPTPKQPAATAAATATKTSKTEESPKSASADTFALAAPKQPVASAPAASKTSKSELPATSASTDAAASTAPPAKQPAAALAAIAAPAPLKASKPEEPAKSASADAVPAAPSAPETKTPAETKVIIPAKAPAAGTRSLVRSLGLKLNRVVIDAGHGGHDTGTIGPTGYTEKELVLDVATRLKMLVETELGAEVVMTRSDDSFVPLETRTAIANEQQADLFISIHANSSRVRTVRGVETYFLNFTSSREALETASRENAASDRSIHELQDLVKRIMLRDKVDESRELAQQVEHALAARKGSGTDRGVKQAPFIVLIGANMPSILTEISFISNPQEEKQIKTPAYRQAIAESLFDGVRSYAESLSGLKTAKSEDKGQKQQ